MSGHCQHVVRRFSYYRLNPDHFYRKLADWLILPWGTFTSILISLYAVCFEIKSPLGADGETDERTDGQELALRLFRTKHRKHSNNDVLSLFSQVMRVTNIASLLLYIFLVAYICSLKARTEGKFSAQCWYRSMHGEVAACGVTALHDYRTICTLPLMTGVGRFVHWANKSAERMPQLLLFYWLHTLVIFY